MNHLTVYLSISAPTLSRDKNSFAYEIAVPNLQLEKTLELINLQTIISFNFFFTSLSLSIFSMNSCALFRTGFRISKKDLRKAQDRFDLLLISTLFPDR